MVAAVVVDERGALRSLVLIDSGVLQGCPLAGLLFALSLDPFHKEFDRRAFLGDRLCMRGRHWPGAPLYHVSSGCL